MISITLFIVAYFSVGAWFTGTTFVTSWYTYALASSYLEGCNFITVAVSTPASAMGHSLLLLWGPESSSIFRKWVLIGEIWAFISFYGLLGVTYF